MALKHREEIVGKRFLSVSSTAKLKVAKIAEWEWRAGIVRAASHKDPKHPDLSVLVEFDDLDWKKRECIKVYGEELFIVFLVEHTLVWAPREDNPIRGGAKNLYWPALNFKPLVDKVGLTEHNRKPIEYLVDKQLSFTECINLKVYQEHDSEKQSASRDYPEVRKAIKQWTEYQDGQKILLTTPSVLVGYRVEVYRVEGTTQWYTAVIVSYNDNTRELTLTDDTVLEEHNEDPCLVQMKLIGDGVVESILKGENVGITPRRRACTQQRIPVPYSTRTRNQHSPTAIATRITTNPAIQRKSRYRQGLDGNIFDTAIDKVTPDSPGDFRRASENCSVIVLDHRLISNKKRLSQKNGKRKDDSDDEGDVIERTVISHEESDSPHDDSSDQESSSLKNHKKSHRKQPRPKRVNGLQEEDCSADDDVKSPLGLTSSTQSTTEKISVSEVSCHLSTQNDVVSDSSDMSKVEKALLDDSTKASEAGRQSPASDHKTDLKQITRNGSPIDIRKIESSKSVNPLVIERSDGLRVFCDPNSKRHFEPLQQPAGLMHPAGLTHTATAAYPRVSSLPQHTRTPTHLSPYGLSTPLIPSHHISPSSPMEQSSIHTQAYRQLISQHPLLPAQYGSPVGLGMLWQQKFQPLSTPSPAPWMVAEAQYQEMRMERAMAQERQNRIERERREEQDRIERERLEREKAEKELVERERQEKERRDREKAERERLERERQDRERLEREERERVQREAVQQHFEESLRLANERLKWNRGSWNSNIPLIKPMPASNMGRCSPVVTVHNHPIHSTDIEKDKREKMSVEVKERHNTMDRLRQDQERWMVLVQQRNEQAADLSHSQNFPLSEQRPGSVHSKMEGYPVPRSSPHTSSSTSSASKAGMNSSPITATSTITTAQPKPEASFSLYGYQPFQHTYITQAQLKAREENKNSASLNSQAASGVRQSNQSTTHSREKESNIAFERSSTPGNSRTSTPGSQTPSTKQQLKVSMHSMSTEHASPVYQPGVGGNGAFRPYEYTSPSPAPPAHQNTASPNLGSRIGTSHYHRASPQQEQPQNLVKGEPTEGSVAQHQPYQKYESSRSAASPSVQVAGYSSPYMTKNNIPATSSPHSYNLIQQGVVPNPLYTPASNSGSTTVPPCVTTVTHISSHQTTSPPLGQTYPRATSGLGITSGTPVCRSNIYPVTQSRMLCTHSSSSNIQAGVNSSRTSTPHETSGRSHILASAPCHKSPSPAHTHNLPMSNPTPPPPTSRIPPPSTSPRLNPTQGSILFNRGTVPQQPIHNANSHSTTMTSTTTDSQMQPLNLQNNGVTKRKPVRDGSSRKRQKTNEDQLMPPQLQPQYHISPVTTIISSSRETSPVSQVAASSDHHGISQGSISASEAPTLTPHTIVSPTNIPELKHDHNQAYDDKILKIKQKASISSINSSAHSNSKINDTPPKLSSCATLTSSISSNTSSVPPVLVGVTTANVENYEESTVCSPVQTVSSNNSSIITNSGSTNHTKLKKAWLQRHSENEDKRNPSDKNKMETSLNNGSLVTSPDNNISLISDNKSSVSTVKEIQKNDKPVINETKNTKTEGSKVPDDSTSSSSEAEIELKNIKRKTRVGRKQSTAGWNNAGNKRQKTTSESSTTETTSKREEAKKQRSSPPEREVISRRRGRKTKGRAPASDDSKKKAVVMKEGKNSTLPSPAKPFEKPSVAQLKRTGEAFLQDGPCYLVAPKLPKCRECRMTPHQRSKKMPNIFCRFYAFRKLRYGKNGTIVSAGFSEPSDATDQDMKLWLPSIDDLPLELDVDAAKYLLCNMSSQFCELVEQEKEAQRLHMSSDTTITWKRVLQGVRELCDVCDTTLFNIHWVCHKCGFVVCIDCYKARKNGNGKESSLKDRDDYQWLLCSNKQAHEQEKLTMTQIIASSALWDVGKILHEIHCKWNIYLSCKCNNKNVDTELKHSTNGICKQLVNAVTKCFSDKDQLQLNGSPRGNKRNTNGVTNLIKQEDGYSSESGSSPLSWLADVALNSSGKLHDESKSGQIKIKSDPENCGDDEDEKKLSLSQLDAIEDRLRDDDDDSNENFSTLRELLIRPAGKGGNGNRSNRNSVTQGNVKSLTGLISNIVEQKVKKLDKEGKQSIHYTRRHSKDCDSLRVCNLSENIGLNSNVPYSWLCNGKLLLLRDPENKENSKLFQEQWKLGEPVIVADVGKKLDLSLWHPDSLCQDFGDLRNDIINYKTGAILPNMPMRKFWEGFENFNKRLKDEDGDHMLLKLKDWPIGDDFNELLPTRFQDLLNVLPMSQYTQREGIFNLASHLPSCFVRPDLGPKMYNAYGSFQHTTKGTINLHVETSDFVNVMVYVALQKETKDEERVHDIVKTYDEGGCDLLMKKRLKEKGVKPGALWHIYHADDADKINNFLLKVAEEKGQEVIQDPITDQTWYIDEKLRVRLSHECGVEGYAVVQCLGDAIFIPAGAPHQVRNLHSCIKVSEDFVSPENVAQCFKLIQQSQQSVDKHIVHEDKLQIKNIIYHAVKNALAHLQASDPEDYQT